MLAYFIFAMLFTVSDDCIVATAFFYVFLSFVFLSPIFRLSLAIALALSFITEK